MHIKHIILATTLFSCTTLLACDDGSPEPEMELNAAEQVDVEAAVEAPEGAETLPFARVELSPGHELRFFGLDDGSVVVEESAQVYGTPSITNGDHSPLELFWRWTDASQDIPTELLGNYETYVGDLDVFFNTAVPRGADRMAAASEITAPPRPPQAAKWWPASCPEPTDYNHIHCKDSYVGPSPAYHFIRTDGPMMYMIQRDTEDTDRDVKLYYRSTVGGYCSWTSYLQISTGLWAVYYYTGSSNYSWQAKIGEGCNGACRYYRSIYQYDATQSSTCLTAVG